MKSCSVKLIAMRVVQLIKLLLPTFFDGRPCHRCCYIPRSNKTPESLSAVIIVPDYLLIFVDVVESKLLDIWFDRLHSKFGIVPNN